MDLIVRRTEALSGEIETLPSKLHTQFASALALLAGGKSVIEHPLNVSETYVMLQAAEVVGAEVKRAREQWSIWGTEGILKPSRNVIDARNSGTALSLLTSIATLAPTITVLSGDPQLRSRPMPEFLKALNCLGGDVHSTKPDGSPPFVVFGKKLKGGMVRVGEVKARYLPAILLSCPYAERRVLLSLGQTESPPQLELTLDAMRAAGVEVMKKEGKLEVPGKTYRAFKFRVPRELSAAAPFVVAAALTNSKLKLRGVRKVVGRDTVFLAALKMAGIRLELSKGGFRVEGGQKPRATRLDLSLVPELLPMIAVIACRAKGRTIIGGVEEARSMKSDRISAIAKGLRKMGGRILERKDGLLIEGPTEFKGCEVDGHDDYAVAGALVVAGLLAEGETRVKNSTKALRISCPRFVSTFQSLGAEISYST